MRSANPQVPAIQVAFLTLKYKQIPGHHHTFEETHSHKNQTPKQTGKKWGLVERVEPKQRAEENFTTMSNILKEDPGMKTGCHFFFFKKYLEEKKKSLWKLKSNKF